MGAQPPSNARTFRNKQSQKQLLQRGLIKKKADSSYLALFKSLLTTVAVADKGDVQHEMQSMSSS
jgi:hypothetical protein